MASRALLMFFLLLVLACTTWFFAGQREPLSCPGVSLNGSLQDVYMARKGYWCNNVSHEATWKTLCHADDKAEEGGTHEPRYCRMRGRVPPAHSTVLLVGNSILRQVFEAMLWRLRDRLCSVSGDFYSVVRFDNGATMYVSLNNALNSQLFEGSNMELLQRHFGFEWGDLDAVVVNAGNDYFWTLGAIKQWRRAGDWRPEFDAVLPRIPRGRAEMLEGRQHNVTSVVEHLRRQGYPGRILAVSDLWESPPPDLRGAAPLDLRQFARQGCRADFVGQCRVSPEFYGHQCIWGPPSEAAYALLDALFD